MNNYETTQSVLFLIAFGLGLVASALYHFMIFSVNTRLPISERIPHVQLWRGWDRVKDPRWDRVKDHFNNLHPKSIVYPVTVTCALAAVLMAMAFVAVRFWDYAQGRLP